MVKSLLTITIIVLATIANAQTPAPVPSVIVEYEASDSTKYAALPKKPVIAPCLRFLFEPPSGTTLTQAWSATYKITITNIDGKVTTHVIDVQNPEQPSYIVPMTPGPVGPIWHQAFITTGTGGPPKDVKVELMTVASSAAVSMVK